MSLKKLAAKAAAILTGLLLIVPVLPVTANAATTLANCALGTEMYISEDGTYQKWILIDHDYLATGNQLLMRYDLLDYSGTITWQADYDDDYGYRYPFTKYQGSALATYLNGSFLNSFTSTVKGLVKSVNLPVIDHIYSGKYNAATTYASKVFVLSKYELFGSTVDEYILSTGSPISYFDTDSSLRAAPTTSASYVVRDATYSLDYWGYVSGSSYKRTSSHSCSITKSRPCIVMPATTPVSSGNKIDGIITPTISAATASTSWGTTNTVTVTATNADYYALTTSNSAPSSGWQSSKTFTVSSNGTYYAWAKSSTDTVSSSKSVTVSKVDRTGPVISAVTVSSTWATSNTATISASDAGVGTVSYYAVTSSNSAPSSGWQTSNAVSISANGTYYAWAKDSLGNVSASKSFTVSRVDTTAPAVTSVTIPDDWATTSTVTLAASDEGGSGVAAYAVTTGGTSEPVAGWQTSPDFTFSANATYYAWVKDGAGNISGSYSFKISKIDTTAPSISYVTVPSSWNSTSTVTISASDTASGLSAYAVSTDGDAPTIGWQASKYIAITENGTYFAWARDAVGNVSARYEFVVSKVDGTAPTVTAVTVPDEWDTESKVTLAASDLGGSSLSAYAVTTTDTAPGSGWQSGTSFTLTANGAYYAFAKDGAGNVSDSYEFAVSYVDTDRPLVDAVSVPTDWGMSSTVTINGSDTTSSVAAYAVTTGGTAAPSSGWQISQKFTFSANGTYYAWVRDQAGNVSLSGYEFEITKIDTTDPVISSITVPTAWTTAAEITINAADADTGIAAYALTSTGTAPADGWQESSSFTITANGTWYAWAKDGVGNTAYKSFSFSKIDSTGPSVSSVSVPTSWGTTSTVTVSATDTGSGVAAYAVTTTGTAPTTGWQASKYVEVDANGKFYAWAKDTVGNVSAGYAFTVSKVDDTAPVISAVTVPDEWGTSSTITLTASDAASGVATYAITETDTAPSTGWQSADSFTLTANGSYYAWAQDAVGNVSDGYAFTVSKVDITKPIVDAVDVTTTWSAQNTVTISASDAGSGVTAYAVSSTDTAPSSNWLTSSKFAFSANGAYYAWAKDAAGNISEGCPFTVDKIDAIAPVISEVDMPDEWATSAEISIVATDSETGVTAYAITESGTIPTSGWQADSSFTITANGTYYAWAKDVAGNTGYKKFTFSKIDTAGPAISKVSVPSSWNSTSTITISASDAASGVTAYAVTDTDATPSSGWQVDSSFVLSENGTWYAWARDAVGNISTGYAFTVSKVDDTAPVIDAVTLPDAWATSSTVSVSASDTASGVASYAITETDAEPSTGWQSSTSFTLSANGTWYAWARDAAGNRSDSFAFTISKIDTTKPTVDSVAVPETWGPDSTVTVSAGDTESGVTSYAVTSTDTAPSSGWQLNGSFTLTANGTYYAWAKDTAGNVSTGFSFTVDKIDSVAPSILGVITPEDWTAAAEISVVATDDGTGIAGYALTRSLSAPTDGWQDSPDFTATANGTWYAWAIDQAGNTAYKYFYLSKIDAVAPSISSVSISTSWGASNTVTISATDSASGVAAYAVTDSDTAPADGWQSSKTITVSENGSYYAWARDAVGNVSTGYAFEVSKVDATAPEITAVTVPDAWATGSTVTLTASDEGGSGLAAYAVTDSDTAPSSGWQTGTGFTLTANGSYYAWARDTAGNVSDSFTFTVSKIDTTKSTVDSVTVPETWDSSSTVTISATDAGSGVTAYAVTKNSTVPSTGWQESSSFTLTANGSYYAWAKDAAGNVSASYAFTVSKVDATKPVISEVSAPTDWTDAAEITIVATDDETGIAGYAISKSSTAPSSGWQESSRFTLTANGSYYAWVKDGAGNTAYKYFTISKIDTTSPTVSSVSVSTSWGASNTVTISASDSASGVTAYAVTDTGTAPTDGWQSSKTVTVSGNGTYYAWARDAVGNVSAGYAFTVAKVDATDPVISAVTVPDAWATGSTVTLTASDDGGSGLSAYAVSDTDTAPSSGWQTGTGFTLTANGSYYAWAKDTAGNISDGFAFTVSKIDTTKPTVDSVAVPETWSDGSSINISASDAGSGVTAYAVTKNSTTPSSGWQESSSFTLTANGSYYAWVKDGAGNVSAGYAFTVDKVDTTKPVISEVSVPTDWTDAAEITIVATDDETGIAGYAISKSSTAPTSGWQTSNRFTLTANGSYYAWVKDGAGNTAYKYFTFNKIDAVVPSISSVSVSTSWGASSTVTVSASDSASGVAAYAVTNSDTAPVDGWQSSKTVTVSGNGSYYAWARDAVGNVSAGYAFTVAKVDATDPVISAVTVPDEWATSSTVTLTASDEGGSGLAAYAVTDTDAAPSSGWQTGTGFTLTDNGTYYAWARDAAGNVSDGYEFVVSKVDTQKPMVSAVAVPEAWASGSTVTVSASDGDGCGVAAYAVSKYSTAPSSGWQESGSFTITSNGDYYAWARDAVGNVSAGYAFAVASVDATKPAISEISVPTDWTAEGGVTITATDAETGIAGYALVKSSTAPESGWQTSPDFTVTENGTWYAWVKDGAGNTAYKNCYVSKIDTTAPSVTYASVSTAWDTANTVTVSATDSASGVAAYAVTDSDTAPSSGWQSSKTVTVTGNGTYYAWARDAVGNMSAGYKLTVSKVDGSAPTVSAVSVPSEWATSAKVTLTAADEGGSGLSAYVVTANNAAPSTGWQSSSSFTLTANGTYCAWAKDTAGNVSAAYEFIVSKVDTEKPVVDAVNVPTDWAMSAAVNITATDTGSGITAYAVTTGGTSVPVSGWQESSRFTFSANGTYYAWVKDNAGNVSATGFAFTLGKIDSTDPTITEVVTPEDWTGDAEITILATDTDTGVAAYAITASSTTPADDDWQTSSTFTLTANGTYYAWAMDGAGNTVRKYFYFSKLDAAAPVIGSISFNNANTVVTVSASDSVSGVQYIHINDTACSGGYTQYQIPDGTRYLTIYAEDEAGNKSEAQTVRVPGWYDVLSTLTIETVTFDADITTATITAATTDTEIAGIYVNDTLYSGNPVVLTLDDEQYLTMQAVDDNGDRSAVYEQRVPGWAEEVSSLAITDCIYSSDYTTAVITATETADEDADLRGITGIEVNGEFFSGNPLAYEIPEDTQHLELRAYNTDGDYSPLLISRVPGWSEIVSTISISNIAFSDYNTRATITALATGGDSVSGIFVNDVYYEGNPVVYDIDDDVEILHVQAVNPDGDLSAMVNKAVPSSTAKSTLKLSIEAPDWTNDSRTKVRITASDSIGIQAVYAKTGEDDDWTDVTSSRYIWIDEDTTVYASVENDDGDTRDASLDIECFDWDAPAVTATQQDKVVNIRAEDKKSGVKAIYVNNVEYSGSKIYGGSLTYTIPEDTTTVTVKAVDEAGNASDAVELAVRTTVTAVPGIIAPSQSTPSTPEPDPEPAAIPDPEPEPEPEVEAEPEVPEETAVEEEPESKGLTTGQMAGLAVGAFALSSAGTIGTIWWLRRRRLMAEVVPELDPKYKKVYDESEFHGTKDPLDDGNVTEVDFNRKVS